MWVFYVSLWFLTRETTANWTSVTVPKCCPVGFTYGMNLTHQWSCVRTKVQLNWNLTFLRNNTAEEDQLSLSPAGFKFKLLEPKCNLLQLDPSKFSTDKNYLVVPGHLVVPAYAHLASSPPNGTYNSDHFCLEYDLSDQDGQVRTGPNAYICFLKKDVRTSPLLLVMYSVGLISSDASLLVTGLVFLVLFDKRNLFTKVLLCYMTSLFFAYFFLTCIELQGLHMPSPWCQLTSISMHFSFLAAFFWLTVMCFDVWWKLRMQLPPEHNAGKDCKQFLRYSMCAYGGPFFLVSIAIILNYTPGIPKSVLKPFYGKSSCWLQGFYSNLAYFYAPVAILLFVNTVFFILTVIRIRRVRHETKILWKEQERRFHQQHKQRLALFVKLFMVMGIFWVMEVVSWTFERVAHVPQYVFYATDFVNTLHGVFIFLLSVCKVDTWRLLRRKTRGIFRFRARIFRDPHAYALSDTTNTTSDQCHVCKDGCSSSVSTLSFASHHSTESFCYKC